MNKKLSFLLFLPLLFSSLVGCNSSDKNSYSEIDVANSIPVIYVDEEFDFSRYFTQEPGYTYSMNVYYHDPVAYEEHTLEVNNFKFTPVTLDPITIVLTATKGATVLRKTINLGVSDKGDPIEELLINTGMSGYADPGFTKTLNKSVKYMRPAENNKTSIYVSYVGNDPYVFGGAVFCPNNFRCLPYWKVQDDLAWENAILRFWVYNDAEADIEFGLRIVDALTQKVDIDMGQVGTPTKIAKPGEWTEVVFPLRPLGITHSLYQDETGTRNDSFTIKAKYLGVPDEEIINRYSYAFAVDLLDVVPASDYPDEETHLPDELDRVLNISWLEHFEREITFDEQYVKDGESSLHFTFVGPTTKAGSQGLCLNSPTVVPLWKDQTWENAILRFWIYNDSDENINIQMLLVDSERNFVVDWNTEYAVNNVALPHEWTLVLISLNRIGVNRPLYKDNLVKDEFNLKFLWDGPENTKYEFYIDGLDIVPASDYPDFNTDVFVPARIENANDGWENLARDLGWEDATITTDPEVFFKDETHDSISSKKIDFSTSQYGQERKDPDFVLSPQEDENLSSLPDFSKGKLDFDVKYSENITDKSIELKVVQETWSVDKTTTVVPIETKDGWYHCSVDFSLISDFSVITKAIRIGFRFLGVNEENHSTAFAHIDNVIFTSVGA